MTVSMNESGVTESNHCAICKSSENVNHELKPSDNFTAWSVLSYGTDICDSCNGIMTNQKYRGSSWIIQNGKTTFFKRDSVLDVLKSEKQKPFIIYITESYKKQGFLNILSRPNYNNEKFFVGFDNDVICVDIEKLQKYEKIAHEAREKKFTKTELLTAPRTHHWEHEKLCITVMKYNHDPLWRLVVFGV